MNTQANASARSAPSRFRWAIAGVASLVLAGGALTLALAESSDSSSSTSSTAAAQPPPPKVTIAPVEQKTITAYEEFTGRVEATETVELRARVSGHLEHVHFQAGEVVKAGDLLFTIDPRWYRAQFDLAKARAEVAEREAARSDDLLAADAISQEEADARKARAAEAAAALRTAQLDLEHTEVRAPITGRISRALVTPGNLVSGAPGGATLLTTIVATGPAYVYADIDEGTLLKFNRLQREGRLATVNGRVPVSLQLADESGYPRHGYIESADNRVNPSTGSLALRLVFANDDGALIPGLFARVRIPVGSPEPALLISERAIGTDQSQKFVLAVDENHVAAYRTVQLGGSAGTGQRIVRAGLNPGDRVIVNGLQRVRPGMTVDPQFAVSSTQSVAAR